MNMEMREKSGMLKMNKMTRVRNAIPKLKRSIAAKGILLVSLLLVCLPTMTPAQSIDDIPANWCRNGLFASEQTEFKLAKVGGNWTARIHFLNDDEGCPSPEVKCETKRYLITGDQVVVSRKFGAWICAWYQPRRGSETVGWLPADKLVMLALPAAHATQRWTGLWKYGEKTLDIQRTAKPDFLKVTGHAVWEGVGANAHVGGVEAVAQPQGNELILVEEECRVALKLVGDYIVASDNSGCGGVNVRFNGVYSLSRAGNVIHAQVNSPPGKDSIPAIRRRYASINKNLARYKAVKKELAGFSTEGGELTAYFDGAAIVKIAVTNNGETNSFFEEFYYSNDKLIFVYRKQEIYDEPMSKVVRIKESRFYFGGDKLIRWVNENAKSIAPGKGEYIERQLHYLDLSKRFTEGARSQEPTIEAPSYVP
jgi:hypothetical protein